VVAERVTELTRDIDVDCSFNNRAKFRKLREESRRKVAEHLGVSPEEIALVRNTSEANNIINNGLALEEGDEVLLWDQNHPTNNVAWDVRAARFGLVVKRVSTPRHPESAEQLLQVFQDALGTRTRVLAITHVSNVSGIRLPVAELCDVAHRRGIHVHVDGAQTWGALNVNLRELGCDSYSASSHKWFVGPKEVGVLYVKEEHIPRVWPSVVAPGWGDDVEPKVKGARKFESMGQRDDACLAAVGTTVDFHRTIGPDRIEARIIELASALKAGLKDMGAKLVTPEDPQLSGGVCIIEAPGEMRRKVMDRLYHEHGIAGAPTGGLRLCPHLYNTREHVERALRGVEALRSLIT
ncbi:MAG: aminotransferase class V-fold PLP-dependent enzyme, partial [Acidobacteriota bacterium]